MEPHPSYQQSPADYDKPKSTNQHSEETSFQSVRGENGRNGPLSAEDKRTRPRDALIQPKMSVTTVTSSTPPPATNAVPLVTSPLTTSKSLLVQASTAKKTSSVVTTTAAASKTTPAKHAIGLEGLTLPLQTTATTSTPTERRLKSPSSSRTEDLKANAKNSPKNLHKTTSSSQISISTHSPKNLQKTASAIAIPTSTDSPKSLQRATLSQIPRATSSPKLRPSSTASLALERTDACKKGGSREGVHSFSPKLRVSTENRAPTLAHRQQAESVLQDGTEPSKEKSLQSSTKGEEKTGREKNKETKGGEDILEDMQVARIPKGRDLTLQVASKCPSSPQDRKQLSPGATTPSAAAPKETVGRADANAMTQERECVTERRKREEREKEEREKERLRERMKERREEERRREEQEKEEKRKEREKAEKEREEAKKNERVKSLREKSFKDESTMTLEDSAPVQTVALQAEPVCVDAGIQAVVQVSCKSTSTSPTLTLCPWMQTDLETDLDNGKSPQTTCSSGLQNGSPESSSNSVWLSGQLSSPSIATIGAMPKFLGPPPYKSPNSHKPSLQHVCQIEIELCSHSSLLDSLALPLVTVSNANPTNPCKCMGLPKATDKDYKASSAGDPHQKSEEADKADKCPPPEVVWDEQGMTWEVYGAAVDMESLGFAIQSHLQKKIREQEQRIGNLRKSISLSEHSQPYGKGANKRKKRNVFRSLFRGSTCCSKTQPKAEAEH